MRITCSPIASKRHWTRQWAEIDPSVKPTQIMELPDGRMAVDVRQTVGDRASTVRQIYTLRDGLVARMDVEPA
jgi:hypothetical protein